MFLEIEDLLENKPSKKYMINIYYIKYFVEDNRYGGSTKIVMKGAESSYFNVKETFEELKKKIMNVKKYSKITPINRFELMELEE